MSELKPLLDGELSAKAARLLRSIERDEPSSLQARQDQVLAAIHQATAASPVVSTQQFLRVGKWTAIGGAAIFVAAMAIQLGWRTDTSSSASTVGGGSSAAPSPVSTASSGAHETCATVSPSSPVPPSPLPGASMRVEDLPTARTETTVARRPVSSATIEDELAAIDRARATLAAAHPAETLEEIDGYRRKFREPRYVEEMDALEVQALALLGRREEARRKGEHFLATRPQSPYEQRIRTALGATEVKR